MAEAAYWVPEEADAVTSFKKGTHLAELATEALTNRPFRELARERSDDTMQATSGLSTAEVHQQWYDLRSEQEPFSPPSVRTRGERTGPSTAGGELGHEDSWHETSIIPSDQYLQFLAVGDTEDFLEPVVDRVQSLREMAREEEDQRALRPGSLLGLFRFLYAHRRRIVDTPQLVLTTDGYLRAEWRRSRDCRVAVRFVDGNTVSFVTFLPDRYVPTHINRVGGDSSIDGFFENTGIADLPQAKEGTSETRDQG